MWQTGGAWLASLIWDHYRFTGDVEFLRANYPAMKGAAQFFLDTLVTGTEPGDAGDQPVQLAGAAPPRERECVRGTDDGHADPA